MQHPSAPKRDSLVNAALAFVWRSAALLFVVTGCQTMGDEAVAQAKRETGCDRMVARYQLSRRSSEYWTVEGCGWVLTYECTERLIGEDDCDRIRQQDLPKPELAAY